MVEYLLNNGAKKVRVLDNLSTGLQSNIDLFRNVPNYEFIKGDITNLETCKKATTNIDYIFHEAALGSVPRSIENPIATNNANTNGLGQEVL